MANIFGQLFKFNVWILPHIRSSEIYIFTIWLFKNSWYMELFVNWSCRLLKLCYQSSMKVHNTNKCITIELLIAFKFIGTIYSISECSFRWVLWLVTFETWPVTWTVNWVIRMHNWIVSIWKLLQILLEWRWPTTRQLLWWNKAEN